MPQTRHLLRSFGGGEVTPEFFGRIDDAKFQTGLATCRNFYVTPHGPVRNRPGTRFVREVKNSANTTILIPFSYSTTQTMVLEFGDGYVRFHTQGATLAPGSPAAYNGATAYVPGDLVSSGGVNYYCIANTTGNSPPNVTYWYALPSGIYEVPTPYTSAQLRDIHYVQSADVLTLVHPSHAPRELRRLGATQWVLSVITFGSTLTAPTGISAAATVATGTGHIAHEYTVTAVDSTGLDESLAGTPSSCNNQLLTTGNYNTVTWSAVSGASRYNIYKKSGGLFSYLGQSDSTSFIDDNITPDISKTPPTSQNPFGSSNNYPGAVSYFEQRRMFGGTNNKPQNFWGTRSGTESNLNYSIPLRDEDAIAFRIAAREANTIRHLVPLTSLVLLTSSAEFRMTSVNTDAITPTSVSIRPQSYIGASNIQPVIVNNNLIYSAARGGHVREMAYTWQANAYTTGDLSLRAPHLFDGKEITSIAYAKAPQPVVWMTNDDGYLLGLTYIPEQQIGSWHWHDTYTKNSTRSSFESVVTVAEGDEDAVYVVVRRVINGNTVRYVERFASRAFAAQEDAYFVDCGVTYDGSPITTISSGISHLEGETVSILADGAVHPPRTVTSGSITLENSASVIQIGLPITADIKTLPLAFEIEGYGQGREKNVNKVWVRVFESSGIFAGPSFDKLVEAKQRTTEPYGTPPGLVSDEISIVLTPTWQSGGQVCFRQSNPLPMTILGITLEVSVAG